MAGEIELAAGGGCVSRHVIEQRDGRAADFQRIQIEPYAEQRRLVNVNEVAARQIWPNIRRAAPSSWPVFSDALNTGVVVI